MQRDILSRRRHHERGQTIILVAISLVSLLAMAALAIAQAGLPGRSAEQAGMSMMDMPAEAVDSEISFPYGFPRPGLYRIFVQVKRSGRIETGVFDVTVE